MISGLFKLNLRDISKGAVSAVVAAVLFAVVGAFGEPNFSVFTADWLAIGTMATNAAVAAFVGYLGKNLLTDENGKVFGKIG